MVVPVETAPGVANPVLAAIVWDVKRHNLQVDPPPPPFTPGEKLQQALDLMAFGIRIQREKLRRLHPDETDAQVEARLEAWMMSRE